MAVQRGAALWQFSCLTLLFASLIACVVISIGGRAVGIPVVIIWSLVAILSIVTMVGSMRLARGESVAVEAAEEAPAAPALPGTRFDEWLTGIMGERSFGVTQLAIDLDVRDDLVEEWILGRQVPTPIQCARIAQLLELPERVVLRAAGWA